MVLSNATDVLHSPEWLAGYLYEFLKYALAEASAERREFTETALRQAVRPEVRERLEVLWAERP